MKRQKYLTRNQDALAMCRSVCLCVWPAEEIAAGEVVVTCLDMLHILALSQHTSTEQGKYRSLIKKKLHIHTNACTASCTDTQELKAIHSLFFFLSRHLKKIMRRLGHPVKAYSSNTHTHRGDTSTFKSSSFLSITPKKIMPR